MDVWHARNGSSASSTDQMAGRSDRVVENPVTANKPVVLPGTGPPARDKLGRVPLGRHGRPPEEIDAIQRARILDSFVREVGCRGLDGAHILDVCTAAKVSPRVFYVSFADKEACFVAAFDLGAQIVCDQGIGAYEQAEGPWEHRLGAALHAMLELLAANPAFARLCIVESQHAGPEALVRLDAVIDRCRKAFGCTSPVEPPPGLDRDAYESVLVGGVLRALTAHVADGKAQHLVELAPLLTYWLALLTVGRERALSVLGPA
jgi:AcrR family transcriptional regulator